MYFDKNCSSIGKVDVELESSLRLFENNDVTAGIESVMSKDGYNILRIYRDDRWNNLNSVYSFEKDVERLIEKYGYINDHAVVVVYGFSNGVMIRELLKRQPANIVFIIYEICSDILIYTLHNEDITDIFESGRVFLYIDGINAHGLDISLRKYMDETNYRINRIISLPRYESLFPEGFSKLQQIFNYAIENCISDQLTGGYDSKREVENAIYNLRYVIDCNVGEQFAGAFPTNIPAVIISAGPSLEKNAELLHQLKGKLLLIAVDTALPYLLSIGLKPDVAVTVSPNKDTSIKSIYDNQELRNITFAIDPIVTHTGLEKINGRKFIYASTTIPYYKELFRLGEKKIDSLDNGGSVSTIALSLAASWGYEQFVLVGQDLAVGDNKKYAGDVSDGSDIRKNMIAIKGYYGDVAYTLPDYKLHLDWFEMFARSNPQYTIYNATEGGAYIEGTTNVELRQIVERYSENSIDYEKVFLNMPTAIPSDKRTELYRVYTGSVARFDLIKNKLESGIEKMDESLGFLKSGLSINDAVIIENQQYIDSILSLCEEFGESFFLERWIGDIQGNILEDIYIEEDDKTSEYIRLLEKLKDYFTDMRESVDSVREIYVKMVKNVESDHSELCTYNVDAQGDLTSERVNGDIYDKNICALGNRYPSMAQKLNKIEVNSYLRPEQMLSKDGTMITGIYVDGKVQYLNSQYSPLKEAEKFVKQYSDINAYGIMVMCGLGNGIIANQMLSSLGEHVRFFFYEPSIEIFIHVLHNYDLSQLINNRRAFIFVEGLNSSEFELSLNDVIGESNYRYIYYDALPKYRLLFPDSFSDIFTKYEAAVQNVRNNIETRKDENRIVVENNIGNLCFLGNCNCEEEFRGLFPSELPVILVASGPSLETNCDILKKLKGKLLIMVVDTALNYVLSRGVRPDIVVSVDPYIREGVFENAMGKNLIYAVASGASNKALTCVRDDRKIFITSNSAYYDDLFQKAGHRMYSLNNGGSVSTVAFALAQSWGYTKFVLVGQDLAMKGDVRYAGNEDHGQDDKDIKIPIEGYYGDTVYTVPDLKIYLDWYEMMARSHPDFTIINSTEGGARIQGTVAMALEELANQFSDISYDYEGLITEHPPVFKDDLYDEVCSNVRKSVDNLDEMKKKLSSGKEMLEMTKNMLANNEKTLDQVRGINDRIGILLNDCDRMYESYYVDCIIADKQGDVMADVYDIASDPREEYMRMISKMQSYVEDMIDSIDEVRGMFEEVSTKMK